MIQLRRIEKNLYPCVEIGKFNYFTEKDYRNPQFPFKKLTDDSYIYWTWGTDERSGQKILLPSSSIFLNFEEEEYDSMFSISTGLACHSDLWAAKLNGILEIIERDAFMLTWKRRIEVNEICNIDDAEIAYLLQVISKADIKIHIFDISMEHKIPCVLVVCMSKGVPAIAVDAAAAPQYREAILKAVMGSMQTRIWGILNQGIGKNATSLEKHAVAYFSEKSVENMDFLFRGNKINYCDINISEYNDLKYEHIYKSIVNRLNVCGFNIYSANITTRDIAATGYHVFRMLIPEMVPLDIDDRFRYNGIERIFHIPWNMKSKKYSKTINKDIHPFF